MPSETRSQHTHCWLVMLLPGWFGLGYLPSATATGVYLEPAKFVQRVYQGHPPEPSRLWLNAELGSIWRNITGHAPNTLRLRYWNDNGRMAWILEEIGRSHPITAGFVVDGGQIESANVLVFRESRGWEVRYPFFTRQFAGLRLIDGERLSAPIDGLSGATLSVNAMERMARLALLLSRHVQHHSALR